MMTVKDKNGKLLSSENPTVIGIWKSAGYDEVTEKKQRKNNKDVETTVGD
jgi:hypothetical protein